MQGLQPECHAHTAQAARSWHTKHVWHVSSAATQYVAVRIHLYSTGDSFVSCGETLCALSYNRTSKLSWLKVPKSFGMMTMRQYQGHANKLQLQCSVGCSMCSQILSIGSCLQTSIKVRCKQRAGTSCLSKTFRAAHGQALGYVANQLPTKCYSRG